MMCTFVRRFDRGLSNGWDRRILPIRDPTGERRLATRFGRSQAPLRMAAEGQQAVVVRDRSKRYTGLSRTKRGRAGIDRAASRLAVNPGRTQQQIKAVACPRFEPVREPLDRSDLERSSGFGSMSPPGRGRCGIKRSSPYLRTFPRGITDGWSTCPSTSA
jgi:hypothetical protein